MEFFEKCMDASLRWHDVPELGLSVSSQQNAVTRDLSDFSRRSKWQTAVIPTERSDEGSFGLGSYSAGPSLRWDDGKIYSDNSKQSRQL